MDDFEDDELDDDEEMDEAIGDPRSTDRYSATKWAIGVLEGFIRYQIKAIGDGRKMRGIQRHPAGHGSSLPPHGSSQ